MRSPFLTCLSVGFAALLAALSTPSLASNQVTH
ncbi:C40 family peptidase, partial [Pseudomonas aeruginosa]